MGANAQTSVPDFTAGQVLTAAQMTEVNTGIPVFADSTARDAAFGGAGEKVLAEGQFAYIEATNTTQYYDGASWVSVGTTPGLTLINTTTFTTATSVSLPTNTFSATYQNYQISLQMTALTSNADFTVRLRASGTDNSTGNYNTMFAGVDQSGTARNQGGSALTSFLFGENNSTYPDNYSLIIDVINPQSVLPTILLGQYNYVEKGLSYRAIRNGGGIFLATTSFDSLSFISSVASSISGTVRVYGYSLS